MSHEQFVKDKKQFRCFVLHLSKLYPSWKPKDITHFLLESENPPLNTTTKSLRLKILRILKRNQPDDLPRSGAPRTTTTIEYIQAVKEAIRLRRNASIRNVNVKLQTEGYKTSNTSVWRAKHVLNLKWWKRQIVQKLTTEQKHQRVAIAKRLIRKYGFKKDSKNYKWICVLNTDFSGMFTLTAQYNQHNEGVYAESISDIPYELKTKSKEKFPRGVMLWGGISYQGLFPKESPIFVNDWLESTRLEGDKSRKKIYFTGERYAKFIRTIIAQTAAKELGDLQNIIFQDDQDRKQRTQVALYAVKHVFIHRIEPKDCAAKLADVWPIENIWGTLKEKLRGREHKDIVQLKNDIKNEWKKIGVSLCQQMIDEIPARLKLVIDQGGNQIKVH